MQDQGLRTLSDIFANKKAGKKPPAYPWQDLALKVINELGIPNFKRNAVFKACKENTKEFVLQALNDTKELCETGERWKYFFKLIGQKSENRDQRTGNK